MPLSLVQQLKGIINQGFSIDDILDGIYIICNEESNKWINGENIEYYHKIMDLLDKR